MAGLWNDIKSISNHIYSNLPGVPAPREVEKIVIKEVDSMLRSRSFVRIAGLSGAVSVAMAAYGAHGFGQSDEDARLKMVGTLLTVGMMLFSGSCYYHALTGNQKVRYVTPWRYAAHFWLVSHGLVKVFRQHNYNSNCGVLETQSMSQFKSCFKDKFME